MGVKIYTKKRNCKNCNKLYTIFSSSSRHCSDKCKKESSKKYIRKPLEERECNICKKKYFPNSGYQKYCSNECSIKAGIKRDYNNCHDMSKRERKNELWRNWHEQQIGYNPKKEIECIICKNKFIRNSISQKICTNKECKLEWQRKKALERYHRDKIKIMDRRKNNIEYCILNKLRMRISCAVKSQGTHKSARTLMLVGCTVNELKQYLEKQFKEGMGWNNYGKDGWVIDHIIPCASFDLTKEEEQKNCFNYTNLQPLWAQENKIKHTKVLGYEIIKN